MEKIARMNGRVRKVNAFAARIPHPRSATLGESAPAVTVIKINAPGSSEGPTVARNRWRESIFTRAFAG
jgi:hypothetical protein